MDRPSLRPIHHHRRQGDGHGSLPGHGQRVCLSENQGRMGAGMTGIGRIPLPENPVVGQRYWMRAGSKTERQSILAQGEDFCGFCGKPTSVLLPRGRRILVECIPIQSPLTNCCYKPDEPPPGSFAVYIIKGCLKLNGQQRWCTPALAVLLTPDTR